MTEMIMMKNKKVPILRFREFSGEWEKTLLDDITKRGSGHTPNKNYPEYYNGDISWISLADSQRLDNGYIEESNTKITEAGIKNSSAVLHSAGCVILSRDAGVGKSAVLKYPMAVSQHFIVWKANENILSNWFLYYILQILKPEFERIAVGNTIKTIGLPYFKKLKIKIPKFPEQQKIATFLTAIDTKIQQLTKKKALLEAYKKGVMQQIFKREIRFKKDEGVFPEWRNRRLNELLSTSKARNSKLKYSKQDVLSVSGEYGVVNQIEFMGRSYAGVSVANYHIVEFGDIVYTKSPLKANPYGIIKVNKCQAGIVSTLYAVYKVKEKEALGVYLDLYFSLDDNLNRYLRPLVRKGAKNDMKINNDYVLNDKISIPGIEEQQKIVYFFSSLDKKIENTRQLLEKMQSYKKGLLQKMFV